MATKEHSDEHTELLKTSLIAQLGLAGVPQRSIRAIVGCDMNRVTAVMKHLVPKSGVRKKAH